jgi:RNA polymerase sigma-70 factor (ECF subfamily)
MDGPDSGEVRDYGEHAPALERFAVLLTGDHTHAGTVAQEALRRARQDPRVSDSQGRTARAWLFNAAHDIIVDERRSGSFPIQRSAPGAVWPDHARPDEINAAVDRLLLGDALAQLPSDDRAVIRGAYYQGGTTAQIAASLHISEGMVKSKMHDVLRSLSLQLRAMGVGPS